MNKAWQNNLAMFRILVGQRTKYGFARYAELYVKLDSGLRRNDVVLQVVIVRVLLGL